MDKWEVLDNLGEGNTSKVYKARNTETGQLCALKLLKEEFLARSADSIKSVELEIQILKGL
jgi:serine/threonine protein kinase